MKSKLLTISAFLAAFTLSFIIQNFVINPLEIEAANTAQQTCTDTYGQKDRVDPCVIGYNGGYESKTIMEACGDQYNNPVKGITYGAQGTFGYCTGGHQFGVAQAKADGKKPAVPSGNSLNNRAKLACKPDYGDSGDRADACQRGYRAAYAPGASSDSVTAACNKEPNDRMVDSCQQGVDHAGRDNIEINEPTESANQVIQKYSAAEKEGKEACEQADQKGGRLDPCILGYTKGKEGKDKDDVCKRYPDGSQRKEACEKGHALGVKAAKAEKDQVDCDMKLSSLLSWIACPVIDMGVNFTDWVFEDFVQPMLESVQVSTDPKDGSYIAWSQFRLIANILLVGTLLAIVFSQARGPK